MLWKPFLLKYGIYTYNIGSRLKYFSYIWKLIERVYYSLCF